MTKNTEKILFYVSFLISINVINVFYSSNISPDFFTYDDYFEQFYGIIDYSGRENGVIYYYLISQLAYFLDAYKFYFFSELIISNAVQTINAFLYLIGLLGLKNLLIIKGFKSKNVFLTLSLLNFSPIALKLIVTMKPEILAFAFITWSLYFLETYLKENKDIYLLLTLFPLLVVVNSKATIIASTGLMGLFLLIKNYKQLKRNKLFVVFIFVFIGLFSLIIYENFKINGIIIFQHNPSGLQSFSEDQYITFSFLYNINFKELFSYPFKDLHANSLIGILLLDTFGDYFKWYENNSESLFSINEVQYSQIWYITHWRELSSIFLGFIYYFYTFYFSIKQRSNSLYYMIYFFGLIPLLLIAYGDRSTYDFSDSELFKSHYFSYLLLISLAFVITSFFENKKNNNSLVYFIIIFNFLFILGFPKNSTQDFTNYISEKNNTSIFCSLNNLFLDDKKSDCFVKEITICQTDVIVKDVRFINYKESYKKAQQNNRFPLDLIDDKGTKMIVRDEVECSKYVKNGFFIDSRYKKIILFPYFNILIFAFGLLTVVFYRKSLHFLS